jgi:hypothetical protein
MDNSSRELLDYFISPGHGQSCTGDSGGGYTTSFRPDDDTVSLLEARRGRKRQEERPCRVLGKETRSSRIRSEVKGPSPHTHNALDDAIEQGEMFRRMITKASKA